MAGDCLDLAPGPLEASDCGGLHVPQHGPWLSLLICWLSGKSTPEESYLHTPHTPQVLSL